ncbi:PqqD family protein, partial [Enterococcus hirae]
EIVERLLEEYEISPEQCEAEVGAFLKDLIEEGLVVERLP